MYKLDNPKNNSKNVSHAFFLSLLHGGAIVIQRYATFHAQSYKRVLCAQMKGL